MEGKSEKVIIAKVYVSIFHIFKRPSRLRMTNEADGEIDSVIGSCLPPQVLVPPPRFP